MEEVQGVAEALVSVIKLASEAYSKQQAAKKAATKKQAAAPTSDATAPNPETAAESSVAQKPESGTSLPSATSADIEPEVSEDAILAELTRAAVGCPAAALPTLTSRPNLSRLLRASVGLKRQLDDMSVLSAAMSRPLEAPPAGSEGPAYRCAALSMKNSNLPKW